MFHLFYRLNIIYYFCFYLYCSYAVTYVLLISNAIAVTYTEQFYIIFFSNLIKPKNNSCKLDFFELQTNCRLTKAHVNVCLVVLISESANGLNYLVDINLRKNG